MLKQKTFTMTNIMTVIYVKTIKFFVIERRRETATVNMSRILLCARHVLFSPNVRRVATTEKSSIAISGKRRWMKWSISDIQSWIVRYFESVSKQLSVSLRTLKRSMV